MTANSYPPTLVSFACTTHTRVVTAPTILSLILTAYALVVTAQNSNDGGMIAPEQKQIRISGDIILGGLFPMHEKGTGLQLCGAIKEDKGIQRVEAMLYAIAKINQDSKLLPGVELGAHILDTCLRDTFGLEQSLEFIKTHMSFMDATEYECSDGSEPRARAHQQTPVAGVIGAAASPVSIMVANILRLFKIPQISYASTGIELSDKQRFGYFSRVVPPDSYQAQVMVDIVREFGWKYVVTIADEGNYGEEGIEAFADLAKNNSLCIANSFTIPRDPDQETFYEIVRALQAIERVRVGVLFVNEDNSKRLVQAAWELGATDRFIWLASDSWGAKAVPVVGQEWAAESTVTILPQRQTLTEFDEYFTSKKLREGYITNMWFSEFWEMHFQCYIDDGSPRTNRSLTRRCTGEEDLRTGHKQEGLVPFVVDSVYAMAHALDDLRRRKCPGRRRGLCDNFHPVSGEELLRHIRAVQFTGVSNHEVRFNEHGDAIGRYSIYQYQRTSNNHYDYEQIGYWGDLKLRLNKHLVRWKQDNATPVSICSDPCKLGQKRGSKSECCWLCFNCSEFEVLSDPYTCTPCPNGSLPDRNQTRCLALPLQYMALDSLFAIVPMLFSFFGILGVGFVFIVFYRFQNTPVIMASGRELCYVLLAGFFLSYLMTFFMVTKPTFVTCGLLRFGLGTSLCMCYSALLTKTNRISRIFNRGIKAMVKRPSYTSPQSQIVICMTLVSIQLAGAVIWLFLEFPGTTIEYPDKKTVVLRCKTSNFNIVISLLYNMVLIVMCTFYALKTRKIPENFNEAKYIAFTMYSTCIVWLAFIPTYFGTNKSDFRIQITALCMCVSISSSVALGCLFVPKVYIVLFQPHKNVRQASKGGPVFAKKSALAGLAGSMNGGVTSPTGLALLIAKGNKGTTTATVNGDKSVTRMTSPNVKFSAVKTSEHSDIELDTSEAEPENNL